MLQFLEMFNIFAWKFAENSWKEKVNILYIVETVCQEKFHEYLCILLVQVAVWQFFYESCVQWLCT